jgi:hypothetical protein
MAGGTLQRVLGYSFTPPRFACALILRGPASPVLLALFNQRNTPTSEKAASGHSGAAFCHAVNAPSHEKRAADAQCIFILSVPCVEEVAAFDVFAGAAVLVDPFPSTLAGAGFEVPRLAASAATTWMMFIMPKSS